MHITEQPSNLPNIQPVKEAMSIFIPNIHPNLPNRNGFVYALIGAPGSGKSSLLLSLFRSSKYYRGKFDNIYFISPESSYLSVKDHPFENHDKKYHELTDGVLVDIYDEVALFKKHSIENKLPVENSLLIIDDFANDLKDKQIVTLLKKIIVKSRHIGLSTIFTLQSYNLFELTLRKMLTNVTIFQFRNRKEVELVSEELLRMKKDHAIELYNYIFDRAYNHLDIDIVSNIFYKNFNQLQIK